MNMHKEKLNAQYAMAILWTSISIVIVLVLINMHISKIGWTLCAHVNRQFWCSITASLASESIGDVVAVAATWERYFRLILITSMDFLWMNFSFFQCCANWIYSIIKLLLFLVRKTKKILQMILSNWSNKKMSECIKSAETLAQLEHSRLLKHQLNINPSNFIIQNVFTPQHFRSNTLSH